LTAATHPLDPLEASEIESAVKILKTMPNFPLEALFSTVQLNEPPKAEVWNYKAGTAFRREAFAIVMDRKLNKTFEATIDLRGKKIISSKEIADVQPLIFDREYEDLRRIVKADARWQAAMKKRGITEFDKVEVDGWAVGQVDPKFTGRLMRGLSYFKGDGDNYYGRPIEGVVAIVDITRGAVVNLTDTGVVPVAEKGQDFSEKAIGKLREKPKPLVITQPDGAGYTLRGNEVVWQKWHFRYTMHPREGIVLHTVAYDDDGKLRPILYRAALSEMVFHTATPMLTGAGGRRLMSVNITSGAIRIRSKKISTRRKTRSFSTQFLPTTKAKFPSAKAFSQSTSATAESGGSITIF
jgi:primary-amine oxidase